MTVTRSEPRFNPPLDELLALLDGLPAGDLEISPDTVGDDTVHHNATLVEQVSRLPVESALPVNRKQKAEIRRVLLRAGYKSVTLHQSFTYSEGGDRWSGIAGDVHDYTMTHGFTCDCSSWTTWLAKNATRWLRLYDFVNGTNWTGGYTGTMVLHGERVAEPEPTDFVFYGDLNVPYHVAMSIGNGRVLSMGRPGAPEVALLGPATQFRRYVL